MTEIQTPENQQPARAGGGKGKQTVISLLGGTFVGCGCGVLILIVIGILLFLFLVGTGGAEGAIILVESVGTLVLPLVIIVTVVAGLIAAVLIYAILARRVSS